METEVFTITRARHLLLSWARAIQFTLSQPISLRPILILSSHLRLGLPNGIFPSGLDTNALYVSLFRQYVSHAPSILFFLISAPY